MVIQIALKTVFSAIIDDIMVARNSRPLKWSRSGPPIPNFVPTVPFLSNHFRWFAQWRVSLFGDMMVRFLVITEEVEEYIINASMIFFICEP